MISLTYAQMLALIDAAEQVRRPGDSLVRAMEKLKEQSEERSRYLKARREKRLTSKADRGTITS